MKNVKLWSSLFLLIFLFTASSWRDTSYKKFTPVEIKWVDILATDGQWRTSEELDEWIVLEQDTVKQLGYLYYEDKNYIVLVDSYINNDFVGHSTKIPKGCIIWKRKI
jgi:hypothetical protein